MTDGDRPLSKVISARDVESAAKAGRSLRIVPGAVVTPAARDAARAMGVALMVEPVERSAGEASAVEEPVTNGVFESVPEARDRAAPPVDLIDPLTDLVLRTPNDAVPEAVLQHTKCLLLDSLSVAMAGRLAEGVPALLESLQIASTGSGRVIGQRGRLSIADAALANGALIHSTEFDSAFDEGLIHPTAGVIPAALAAADAEPCSGRDVLVAVALALEVVCRISFAATVTPPFYRCGAMGAFGGVAALARLWRLSAEQAVRAFGIAYSHVVMPWQAHEEGSTVHGALPGLGAQAAVNAVRWAQRGGTGPRRVLEGNSGYFASCEGGHFVPEGITADLGRTWLMTWISLKPYPSGRLTHGAIEAALRLRAEHGIAPATVSRVIVEAGQIIALRTGRKPGPNATVVEQRLSVPYTVARALLDGRVGLDSFGAAQVADPRVQTLLHAVDVVPAPDIPTNDLAPVRVRIETSDGRAHRLVIPHLLGSRQRPLDREGRLAKTRHCWGLANQPAWRSPEKLAHAVESLEAAPNLNAVWTALGA